MRALSCLPIMFIVAACGGGGGGDPDSVAELVDDMNGAACSRAFDCKDSWTGTEEEFNTMIGASVSECQAMLSEDPVLPPAVIQAAIDDGGIIFHADKAGACVDSFASLECATLFQRGPVSDDPACLEIYEPTLADGATCTTSLACISGACDGVCITIGG